MVEQLTFDQTLFRLRKGRAAEGRMRVNDQGLAFRVSRDGVTEQIYKKDLRGGRLMRVARGFQLRLELRTGGFATYEGFTAEDASRLTSFFKQHLGVDLQTSELSLKGWNWGQHKIEGNAFSFLIEEQPAFEIPLNAVAKASTLRYETTIEFHQDDGDDTDPNDQMIESMRFLVVPEAESDKPHEAAEQLCEDILSKADVIEVSGDPICSFDEVTSLLPRSRFEIKFYDKFVNLHGKTHDHKIVYDNIERIFCLLRPDDFYYIVLGVEPPLRQETKRYKYVVLQFVSGEQIEGLSVQLGAAEESRDRLDYLKENADSVDGDEVTVSGNFEDVFVKLLEAFTKRKASRSKNNPFETEDGRKAFRCSHKADEGYLFPLEKAFMFLHKPTLFLPFSDVRCCK